MKLLAGLSYHHIISMVQPMLAQEKVRSFQQYRIFTEMSNSFDIHDVIAHINKY